PRRAWRGWPSRRRWRRKTRCRASRRRSNSPRKTAAACCTRSHCGRRPPTSPSPRAAWPRCRRWPGTIACTNGRRARRWRARAGPAAAIKAMAEQQRGRARCAYFAARLTEMAGDKAGAQALYRDAARESDFHGFLAADRLDQPYALCPWMPPVDAAAKAVVARDPALVRALALQRIDRAGWAAREWKDALSRFDDRQR